MGALDGRVAFITGGGRGQGRSLAVTFAREGANIIVCDIRHQLATVPYTMNSRSDLDETRAAVESTGMKCLALEADVRNSAEINEVVKQGIHRFDRIDILCSNAGMWVGAPVEELTDAQWNDTIGVNLTGAFNSVRAVVPHMKSQRFGRIILTASTLAKRPVPNQLPYVSAKRGLLGMMDALAVELGRYNITVNAVCPSVVRTGMAVNQAFNRSLDPSAQLTDDGAAEILMRLTKLGVARAEVEDVSNAVLFLASDMARYVTSVAIDINPI